MGQRVLPKELRTAKLNSLPEELRKIADELICDKFEIREEVVKKKSSNPFHDLYEFGFGADIRGFEESCRAVDYAAIMDCTSRVSPGVERRIDFYSRSSVFVTPITAADTRAFHDAVVRLDEYNAPNHNRKAIISPPMASEMRTSPEFALYANYSPDRYRGRDEGQYLATMFGVPIFVVPGVVCEMYA